MSVSVRSAEICVLLSLRNQLLRKVHLTFFLWRLPFADLMEVSGMCVTPSGSFFSFLCSFLRKVNRNNRLPPDLSGNNPDQRHPGSDIVYITAFPDTINYIH